MTNTYTVMVTGHRPSKLGGYATDNPIESTIRARFKEILARIRSTAEERELKPIAISGMALGCDQWWAEEALSLGIDVYAYIPFKGQESKWPPTAQEAYKNLLNRCIRRVIVSEAGYASWKMQKRNRVMVDDANACVAVWDGSSGGTGNCVKYIKKQKKSCLYINANTFKENWNELL